MAVAKGGGVRSMAKGEGETKMREKKDKIVILLNYFDSFNQGPSWSLPKLDGSTKE